MSSYGTKIPKSLSIPKILETQTIPKILEILEAIPKLLEFGCQFLKF